MSELNDDFPNEPERCEEEVIDIAAVRRIISTTRHPTVEKGKPLKLSEKSIVLEFEKLLQEFQLRRYVDRIMTYKDLQKLANRVITSLRKSMEIIEHAFGSGDFLELFLTAGKVARNMDEMEEIQDKELLIRHDLLPWLIKRTEAILQEIQDDGFDNSSEPRFAIDDHNARSWLYDVGIPELFTLIFATPYRVLDGGGAPAPGGRFTTAVFNETATPVLSLAALHNRERKRRRRKPGA